MIITYGPRECGKTKNLLDTAVNEIIKGHKVLIIVATDAEAKEFEHELEKYSSLGTSGIDVKTFENYLQTRSTYKDRKVLIDNIDNILENTFIFNDLTQVSFTFDDNKVFEELEKYDE